MTYIGHIENGSVVLDVPVLLPEGSSVCVRVMSQPAGPAPAHAARRNWRGAYRNSGPVPNNDDIAQMRREAWPST